MKDKLPDFANKLVSVSVTGSNDTNAIEHPRWEMQGGRLFLVGTVPRNGSPQDWCQGTVCAVAWDQVSDYLVFDSVDDYGKRLAIYEKRKRKA